MSATSLTLRRRLRSIPKALSTPARARAAATSATGARSGWRSRDVVRAAALVLAMYLALRLLWFANALFLVTFLGILFAHRRVGGRGPARALPDPARRRRGAHRPRASSVCWSGSAPGWPRRSARRARSCGRSSRRRSTAWSSGSTSARAGCSASCSAEPTPSASPAAVRPAATRPRRGRVGAPSRDAGRGPDRRRPPHAPRRDSRPAQGAPELQRAHPGEAERRVPLPLPLPHAHGRGARRLPHHRLPEHLPRGRSAAVPARRARAAPASASSAGRAR